MKPKLSPFLWGGLTMVLALTLTLYVASRQKVFIEVHRIATPQLSLGPTTAYFFGVVAVIALILFFIPLSGLRRVFRFLFALIFGWGVFVITALILPQTATYPALIIAVIFGLAWLFWTWVWLHDLLLLIALCAAGSVYGGFFSPSWTFMVFMLIIAVYDLLAVRFGFMVWMADKLSASTTLPAFVFPKQIGDWRLNLQSVRVGELKKKRAEERDYAVLGGGDIGFPLILSAAVFFEDGLASAVLVGAFALMGLMSAFLIQVLWLKGKPMPALPPIAGLSLVGFLIASAFLG
jgi:presenilin-like A22 family membrane protease